MKKISVFASVFVLLFTFVTPDVVAQELDSYTRDNLISRIQNAQSPVVSEDYVVFTAENTSRHVGIAFDFEDYRIIHSFERLDSHDADNEVIASVLFYIQTIPKGLETIGYRLIIDGLWTTDPLNPVRKYDRNTNALLSYVKINRPKELLTENKQDTGVHFVYIGNPGLTVRLAGSFTNWDSFIYYLTETEPGVYELNLPLPRGTYYYAFYTGVSQIKDNKNPNQVYTTDGRIASVIKVN